MLAAAAVALRAIGAAEGAAEVPARETPQTAFDEVVARAFAKDGAAAQRPRGSRASAPEKAADPALSAYVAALIAQNPCPTPPVPQAAAASGVPAAPVPGNALPVAADAAKTETSGAAHAESGFAAAPVSAGFLSTGAVTPALAANGLPSAPTPLAANGLPSAPAPLAANGLPDAPAPLAANGLPDAPAPLAAADNPASGRVDAAATGLRGFEAPRLSACEARRPGIAPIAGERTPDAPRIAPEALQATEGQRAFAERVLSEPRVPAPHAPDTPATPGAPDAALRRDTPVFDALRPAGGTADAGTGGAGTNPGASGFGQAAAEQYARVQARAREAVRPAKDGSSPSAANAPAARPAEERRTAAPEAGAHYALRAEPGFPAQGADAPRETAASDAPRETAAAFQLARATASAIGRGETQYRLKLRPEGVGEVAVTISAREKELHLSIRASSESTRALILSQIDDLKSELAAGDYRLEGFSVDVNGGGTGGEAFSAFQQGQDRQHPPGRQPDARPARTPAEARRGPALEARAGAINLRV